METLIRPDFITACVAGIEVFLFGVEHAGAPVIFLTHGRGGAAVYDFDRCRELAADGYVVVALDQRNHGRRMVDPRANGGWAPHHAADMYGCLLGTATDVRLLIDMLPARVGLPLPRIGMTGFSMGGHATLLAMTLDPRIEVGVPFIGSGDYRELMRLRALNNDCPEEEFPRYFPPELATVVAAHDPIRHPERFADRPLLLSNGAADTLVQLVCNERFVDACRPYYSDPARLRLSAYPGIGHAVTPEMWAEGMAWFKRWLPVSAPRD